MVNISKIATGVILTIIALIVVFQIYSNSANDLVIASGNLSTADVPLASLFGTEPEIASIC